MPTPQIQLTGMKEFRKAVKGKETDVGWRDAIKGTFGPVAQYVAGKVQARASARGRPRYGSAAIGSITGKGTTTNASVSAFKGIAWGPGTEFGSGRYRQFPPRKEGGYSIYPTIEEEQDNITEMFFQGLDANLRGDGL